MSTIGKLNLVELSAWVEPKGFVQAKSEIVFLMSMLDANGDLTLTKGEILRGAANGQEGGDDDEGGVFLRSQVQISLWGLVCVDEG
jgi:hypothetical protein